MLDPAEQTKIFAGFCHELLVVIQSHSVFSAALPELHGRVRLSAIEHSCTACRTPRNGYSTVVCRRILGGASDRVSKLEMSV
jgi:hypothetical protein